MQTPSMIRQFMPGIAVVALLMPAIRSDFRARPGDLRVERWRAVGSIQ